MPTPEEFLEATKWFGAATLAMAVITALAFVLGWEFRFRLVGITSFMGVLTGGVLGVKLRTLHTYSYPWRSALRNRLRFGGGPNCDHGTRYDYRV